MSDNLLGNARQQTAKAEPSIRAAALLRIARAASASDAAQARTSLLEGMKIIRSLELPKREYLFDEARGVAAAVDPALLAEIPEASFDMHRRFATIHIVHTMLAHGHVDTAFDYVLSQESASFPFDIVGNVLHHLDPNNP